jgi:hypothetical protein
VRPAPSARGVSRSAKRCSASRLVIQRPPRRTASSLTRVPSGAFEPLRTQRGRVDR